MNIYIDMLFQQVKIFIKISIETNQLVISFYNRIAFSKTIFDKCNNDENDHKRMWVFTSVLDDT